MAVQIRVVQEDWAPLRNLYRSAARFTRQTGIDVQITFSNFDFWWPDLEAAFRSDQPAFDLLGCDEMVLWHYAAKGLVEPLDDYIRADAYPLDDFYDGALNAATVDGRLYGLPHVFDPNMLLYREDIFARYGVAVPQTFAEMAEAALTLQTAVRADGDSGFCGMVLRGSAFESFMECGMTIAAGWGVQWFHDDGTPAFDTPVHAEALAYWVDLLRRAGPVDVARYGYERSMAFFRSGRAAMSIMQISEVAIGIQRGGIVADNTKIAPVPTGPDGRRCAGFYGPVYAIPVNSPVKQSAWQLAKFLNAPDQLIFDAEQNAFIPSARKSLLDDENFTRNFRPNLIETFRESLPIAAPERPRSSLGAEVVMILGRAYNAALTGAKTPAEAIREARIKVENTSPQASRGF